jgi:hypothetical protein
MWGRTRSVAATWVSLAASGAIRREVRFREGETPAEDAVSLLAEAGEVLTELESLIR